MAAPEKLDRLVTTLRARPRRRRLKEPVTIDGRQFTEEVVEEYLPYHRKLAASVREGAAVIRFIRDVAPGDRLDVGGQVKQITALRTDDKNEWLELELGEVE